jgi:hypothetical protein
VPLSQQRTTRRGIHKMKAKKTPILNNIRVNMNNK